MPEPERVDWLATLRPWSDLDLRGTQVQAEHLHRIKRAFDDNGRSRFRTVNFAGAQFDCRVLFVMAQFAGNADFRGARFNDEAMFSRAQFGGHALFSGAQFGEADFLEAKFFQTASFEKAHFDRGGVGFWRAKFTGEVTFSKAETSGVGFDEAQFEANAIFNQVQFDSATFAGARFAESVWFNGSRFGSDTEFAGTQFAKDASFYETHFTGPVELGPLFVGGTLYLAQAVFETTVVIEVVGKRVRLDRATFGADASVHLRYAELILDGARLAQPMTIAAADPFTWHTRLEIEGSESAFPPVESSPIPRLLSVRGIDAANLVVIDLSLTACQFAGAHHLDQLRLEGAIGFGQPPHGLRFGRAWPPLWWWTRRQTLAEEHAWRATQPKGAGWHPSTIQPPAWLKEAIRQAPGVISPERLAGLYRSLRQAQENRKNEPGAADFYYGEMEMRRFAKSTPWAERVILFGYWLIAGYGLRGLRALAALTVVVAALAGLFHAVGFRDARPAPSWLDSLLYTAGSTVSISDDALKLTAWGKLLRILLRLLGPLLLGLTLLSVRNRVKR